MDEIANQPEVGEEQAAPSRSDLVILLAAAISLEVFALITLVFQILGWGSISGWGWLGAIVQVGLLLAIAVVAPLLMRDLLARLASAAPPPAPHQE